MIHICTLVASCSSYSELYSVELGKKMFMNGQVDEEFEGVGEGRFQCAGNMEMKPMDQHLQHLSQAFMLTLPPPPYSWSFV